MKIYMVGIMDWRTGRWDIQGIYDSAAKAEQICLDARYFVGPIVMNKSLPAAGEEWPYSYYPRNIYLDATD